MLEEISLPAKFRQFQWPAEVLLPACPTLHLNVVVAGGCTTKVVQLSTPTAVTTISTADNSHACEHVSPRDHLPEGGDREAIHAEHRLPHRP